MSQNEEVNTPEKAEEEMRLRLEENERIQREAKDNEELSTIKGRILQQFQSPNSEYRGITTSKEEENMIEDQAKAILRQKRQNEEGK